MGLPEQPMVVTVQLGFLGDDLGCVHIAVVGLSAVRTVPATFGELELSAQVVAGGSAQMRAWEEPIHHDQARVL